MFNQEIKTIRLVYATFGDNQNPYNSRYFFYKRSAVQDKTIRIRIRKNSINKVVNNWKWKAGIYVQSRENRRKSGRLRESDPNPRREREDAIIISA